ncbi:MAG: putative head completion protein [Prokaryotic dsDNA virus sp.]|nr:MAG: putative head completion protein [Prokaryotic dsDNA virus sp.]|tara:strand:+ start:4639 stop:4965 length:327 start_codon:yes stop_codon:yes gene_type:complete
MTIGSFRNRIALQTNSTSTDLGGGQSDSWSTSTTVWAKAENMSGSESIFGNQIRGVATYKFTIRYISALTEKYRVSYNSKTFNISHVKDVYEGKRRFQEITAIEGVAT